MERHYYSYVVRSSDTDHYVIWYAGEPDGLYVGPDEGLPTFASHHELECYATNHRLLVDDSESDVLDLDAVRTFGAASKGTPVRCNQILNAWNFFIDLARSLGGPGTNFLNLDQELNRVYEKVFWGCNLAPVTPPGKHYTPIWSSSERASIQQLMKAGLLLWDTAIGNPSRTRQSTPTPDRRG